MKVNLIEKSIEKVKSDLEIIILDDIKDIEDKEILENLCFEAKDESAILLPELKKIYVGCEANDYDSVAIAVATGVKKLIGTKFKSAKLALNDLNLKALVEGALLGSYSFVEYKSEKKKKQKQELNICSAEITKEDKKFLLIQLKFQKQLIEQEIW